MIEWFIGLLIELGLEEQNLVTLAQQSGTADVLEESIY